MSIRVAMIADLPEPGQVIDGGVQAVTSSLVGAMERLPDVELHVVRLKRSVGTPRVFEGERHRLHVLPMARLGTVTGFAQDQQTIGRRLAEIRPDVVHSQGAGHYGILAQRSRYPAVITIHGILSEEVRYSAGLAVRARAAVQARLSEHYCIRRARHTILISQYVADYYGARLAGDSYLVPNPVDDRFFEIERRENGGKILFAGRLTERKGVKDLLRAAGTIGGTRKFEVVLAGSLAEAKHVNELRSLSRQLGISESVHFAGPLDFAALARELAECTCLVLPSYQETAPMVIQEAMAAGVPVIATAVGGVAFQVEHGRTGFVYPPGDVAALTRHLGDLLSSAKLRQDFGAEARVNARCNFHALAVAERTVEVYRQVLGGRDGVRDGQ